LASCTKAVTAALVAKLADEGKLAFDDPVRRHLPVFHLSDPNADALVALKDLLTHRTGVNGHDLLWYRSKLRSDEIITCIGKLPLNEPFRGAYQYSTLMYMAAGKAAANANGTTWEDAVRVKLFEPPILHSPTLIKPAATGSVNPANWKSCPGTRSRNRIRPARSIWHRGR
jgi:CubicO group peptidase (beta-lactamase class C family)